MGASENIVVVRRFDARATYYGPNRAEDSQLNQFQDSTIPLLAKYIVGRDLFAIYPCASGNLRDFWVEKFIPTIDVQTVQWFAAQMVGIIGAVCSLRPQGRYTLYMEPDPKRILWFRSFGPQGRLVVSDLTLVRFHEEGSSLRPRSLRPRHFDYEAPEAITQSYPGQFDWGHRATWTLGCVFLELLTWLLGGEVLREDFETRRDLASGRSKSGHNRTQSQASSFFETRGSDQRVARVRPEVKQASLNAAILSNSIIVPYEDAMLTR